MDSVADGQLLLLSVGPGLRATMFVDILSLEIDLINIGQAQS
jgi:hypothetical protein